MMKAAFSEKGLIMPTLRARELSLEEAHYRLSFMRCFMRSKHLTQLLQVLKAISIMSYALY